MVLGIPAFLYQRARYWMTWEAAGDGSSAWFSNTYVGGRWSSWLLASYWFNLDYSRLWGSDTVDEDSLFFSLFLSLSPSLLSFFSSHFFLSLKYMKIDKKNSTIISINVHLNLTNEFFILMILESSANNGTSES